MLASAGEERVAAGQSPDEHARAGSSVQKQVGRLVLEGPRSHQGLLDELAEGAGRVMPHLERELGVTAGSPFLLVLIPPPGGDRSQIAGRLDSLAPPWASGFLFADARIGGIRLALVDRYPYGDSMSVLAHECAHMLLYDAVGRSLPRWFEEGVATWLGRRWGVRDMLVYSSSLLAGELPPLAEIEQRFESSPAGARFSYAASFEFINWSVDRYGTELIPSVLVEAREGPFAQAWQSVAGVSLEESEADWRRGSLWLYRWLPLLGGSGTAWLAITLLFLVASARKRHRAREIMARWEVEERAGDPPESGSGWVN